MKPVSDEKSNPIKTISELRTTISNLNALLDIVKIPVAFIYKDNSRRELTIEERLSMYINSQKKF